MLNRSASLATSTSVLEALPGKLDVKRQSPSILYISCHISASTSDFGTLSGGIIKQRRFSLACVNVHTHHNLDCLHTQSIDIDKESDQN